VVIILASAEITKLHPYVLPPEPAGELEVPAVGVSMSLLSATAQFWLLKDSTGLLAAKGKTDHDMEVNRYLTLSSVPATTVDSPALSST
jgi:hypothetical protein